MLLNEILWTESQTAMVDARKHPYDWIHFTNTPKLGINPKKSHRDPPGIYFYPIRWLLRIEDDDGPGLSQYGTSMPYYYICSIPTHSLINLSRMTIKQIEMIATRNGWYDDLEVLRRDSKLLNNSNQPMAPKLLRKPGGFFYASLDYLANIKGKQWLPLLKGINGLYDPGYGIISPNETHQCVVFNRSLLKIISFGNNKDYTMKIYAEAVKQIAEELGVKFFYKNNIPCMEIENDGSPVILRFDAGNYAVHLEWYNEEGYWMHSTEKYTDITSSVGDLEDIKRSVRYMMKRLLSQANKPNQTFWTPNQIMFLLKLLAPRVRKINTYKNEHGGIRYIVSIHSTFIEYLILNVFQDTITVEAEITTHDYKKIAEITARDNYIIKPNTNMQAAAAQILDVLKREVVATLPEIKNIDSSNIFRLFPIRINE
jgi:hypothetical protein